MRIRLMTVLEHLLTRLSTPDATVELIGWPGLPVAAQPPMCSAD